MKNKISQKRTLKLAIGFGLFLILQSGALSAQTLIPKPLKLTHSDSVKVLVNLYASAKIKIHQRETQINGLTDTLKVRSEQEPVKIKKAATEAKKQGRKQGVIIGAVGLTLLEVLLFLSISKL